MNWNHPSIIKSIVNTLSPFRIGGSLHYAVPMERNHHPHNSHITNTSEHKVKHSNPIETKWTSGPSCGQKLHPSTRIQVQHRDEPLIRPFPRCVPDSHPYRSHISNKHQNPTTLEGTQSAETKCKHEAHIATIQGHLSFHPLPLAFPPSPTPTPCDSNSH